MPSQLTRTRSGVLGGLSAAIILVLALAAGSATAQASGGTVTRTFSDEGMQQTFVVPAGVESIEVVAIGGAGGETIESEGGFGARVEGQLSVSPGQTLYAEVGNEGNSSSPISHDGGGASDVRTAPRAAGLSPDDRLIVAGAGGGAGEEALEGGESETKRGGSGGNAGDANGEEGGDGIFGGGGEGGTLTRGGFEGMPFNEFKCPNGTKPEPGGLETGGAGGVCRSDGGIEGGQGGAGYYGGGGGAAGYSGGGGGGGSSLVPAGGSFILATNAKEKAQVQISYTQPANPPAVVTEAAGPLTTDTADLNATVNPEDQEVTSCEFEYGTSTSYGATVPCSPSAGSGIAPVSVSARVEGLEAGMTYHYRVVAVNANGTSGGSDETLTTLTQEAPELTGISPEAGPAAGGETVTIAGRELEGATSVKFGSNAAKSFTVNSSESITAVSPAGTGTVSVFVTTPGGTNPAGTHFAFLAVPTLARITPSTGPAAGGTTVKIFGSGFDAASTVSFGTIAAASVTYHSEAELTAVSPPGAETVNVTVTTPDAGTSAVQQNARFGYESGAPEYGSCLIVGARYLAEFTDSNCEKATSSAARYRWDPGAEKAGFTVTSSGSVALETVTKAKVTCTSAAITGTLTSRGTRSETIRFKGCASGASKCTSSGLTAGEVQTSALQGVLGWESKAKKKGVLALSPVSQPFMQYQCEGSATTTVTGSVLVPVKTGKMEASSKLKMKASKGKQKPEAPEGGGKEVLSSSTGSGPSVQVGLTLGGTQVNEEAVEINPIV
jgi:hypothetical protein